MRQNFYKRLALVAVVLALLLGFAPSGTPLQQPFAPRPAAAQALIINQILYEFSNYVGISPPLYAAELDLGETDRSFEAGYEFSGLDLRDGPVSCDSRIMEENETIVGSVGFVVYVSLNGRRYEFRTNLNASPVIRCFNGAPIDWNGSPRGIGATIDGDRATDIAMGHLSTWLDLGQTITVALANDPPEADDDPDTVDFPRVFYRWVSVVYNDASLGCPQGGGVTYDVRDTLAYRVTLTVNGFVYSYRVRADGGVVLLCRGGRPDESSIGLNIDSSAAE
jgi:hypothetical protein